MRSRQSNRLVFILTAIAVAAGLAGMALLLVARYIPVADPQISEFSNRSISYTGMYTVYYKSELDPIPLNQVHRWTLHLEKQDAGLALDDARFFVAGKSADGHPLPTRPVVDRGLGNGNYLLDGMMFDRPGEWVVYFYITFGRDTDTVEVHVNVPE